MRPRYRFFLLLQICVFLLSGVVAVAAVLFRGAFPWLTYGVWFALGAFNVLYMWVYVTLLWYFTRYDFDGKTLMITRGIILRRIQHIDIKSIQYVTNIRLPFTEKAAASVIHTIGGAVIIFC